MKEFKEFLNEASFKKVNSKIKVGNGNQNHQVSVEILSQINELEKQINFLTTWCKDVKSDLKKAKTGFKDIDDTARYIDNNGFSDLNKNMETLISNQNKIEQEYNLLRDNMKAVIRYVSATHGQ